MTRFVVRQSPNNYHLYSTVAMGDISGRQSRSEMISFLQTYGMTVDAAEEMVKEGENRPTAATVLLIAPMERNLQLLREACEKKDRMPSLRAGLD